MTQNPSDQRGSFLLLPYNSLDSDIFLPKQSNGWSLFSDSMAALSGTLATLQQTASHLDVLRVWRWYSAEFQLQRVLGVPVSCWMASGHTANSDLCPDRQAEWVFLLDAHSCECLNYLFFSRNCCRTAVLHEATSRLFQVGIRICKQWRRALQSY